MFGPHLLIDGSRCNAQKLGDRLLIERLLSDYPAAIGMTKIGGPYLFEYQAPDPAYSGVSGIVVIAESHIALHTFPALDYFTLDIFSCKHFDHETAIRYVRDALEVGQMDRMLVQRGLGFRGPHHGAAGATDELIAAAEARLAAGIVSLETATPEVRTVVDSRASAMTRTAADDDLAALADRPSWPTYGETPDYGSYGGARGTLGTAGASEPVQLNATASISGLLDKLGGTGLGGRTVGRALDEWERLARDPDCQVVLALSTPVVGAGLGELLAAAIGRRYVDIVVMSGEDVFADVRAALGFGSTANMDDPASGAHDVGLEPTRDFLAGLAATLAREADRDLAGWEFTRALGKRLAEHAPRTGVLRAAVAADVPVFVPDLVAGPCGLALALAQRRGAAARLDPLADLTALADLLAACAHYGVIAAGSGVATATVTQADELAGRATRSAGGVYLDVAAGTGPVGAGVVVAQSPPGLVLPLLLTGLAQRLPGTIRTPAVATTAHSDLAR